MSIRVSADIEAGYGYDEQSIIGNLLRTADTGVAGINMEDSLKHQSGLRNLKEHCQLLANRRATLDNHGYKNFFIHARTDTYFQLEQPYEETLTRAKAYVESGASGIFILGLTDVHEIKGIRRYGNTPI
ncbi:isocitrate lyase/phosphoenolpyruvate mutase family protein [Lysinibacillus macroides]|uniref:isocitrate lyase/phosphoenolpyruvate mutase family protein n=1 Tax=Lysinibacillus macroides TaxID=33935 RepID=UPI000A5DC4B5|nr:isocitrate lyase/phosphoenolpyruvate mutase family protein [Lysinibacillus macroides]